MKSEKMLTWIVIIAILYFVFRHVNRLPAVARSAYNVKPYGGWNLYGQAKGRPLPYPHLYNAGPKVPAGAPEWLLDGFSVGAGGCY